jgi:ABC-type sugar transport systems, ATPase components
MAALTLQGVKKTYDGKQFVLHGIDVDVADGEFVVMVGPSGCGKSTLLRMVAGLEGISDGTVSISGKVVNRLEPKDRNIAMVFQNYALYPHMSVAENMGYALKIAGVDRAQIAKRVDAAAQILELGAAARTQAARVVRRATTTRRHGPRDRARAGGISVR